MSLYFVDGSKKENDYGVGIVRYNVGKIKTFYKHYKIFSTVYFHEVIAIHQTLSIISKKCDKNATIVTDDIDFVRYINNHKYACKKAKKLKYYKTIKIKLERMKQQGYTIQFFDDKYYRCDRRSPREIENIIVTSLIKQAHSLSRNYIIDA